MTIKTHKIKEPKTKILKLLCSKLNISSALVIESGEYDNNFVLSSRNIKSIKYSDTNGLNAIDIMKHEKFIMSKDAVTAIEKRLLG